MVYSNRFVMCVLHHGTPLQEPTGTGAAHATVSLPFGAEYALRFRNKNDRRAVVKFFIDGENVSGGGYVIDANSHIDIRRHHAADLAFKFVTLDSPEAVSHGKNGPNDGTKGLIEARFFLEKQPPPRPVEIHHHHHYDHRPSPWRKDCDYVSRLSGASWSASAGEEKTCGGIVSLRSVRTAVPATADGCTVAGSATGQFFSSASVDLEDHFTTLTIKIVGYDPLQDRLFNSPDANINSENERLRREIAELENARLKEKLAKLKSEVG